MSTDRDQLVSVLIEHVITDNYLSLKDAADAILAAGWRPPARVITDSDDMDALPWGSVVLAYGVAHQACPAEFGELPVWLKPTRLRAQTSAELLADCRGAGVTVLYIPTEKADE
jgi:hypothetical protein